MKRSLSIFIAAATLALGSAPVFATMVYSTFGANFAADSSGGWVVGPSGPYDYALGMIFTPNSSAYVDQIDLAVNGTGPATVSLYTANSDSPGSLLQSWSVQPVAASSAYPNPIVSITSNINVYLSSGTAYMLEVSGSSDV